MITPATVAIFENIISRDPRTIELKYSNWSGIREGVRKSLSAEYEEQVYQSGRVALQYKHAKNAPIELKGVADDRHGGSGFTKSMEQIARGLCRDGAECGITWNGLLDCNCVITGVDFDYFNENDIEARYVLTVKILSETDDPAAPIATTSPRVQQFYLDAIRNEIAQMQADMAYAPPQMDTSLFGSIQSALSSASGFINQAFEAMGNTVQTAQNWNNLALNIIGIGDSVLRQVGDLRAQLRGTASIDYNTWTTWGSYGGIMAYVNVAQYVAQANKNLRVISADCSTAISMYLKTLNGTSSSTYRVKAGETLQRIAQARKGDWRRFTDYMTINGLQTADVTEGQLLVEPQ